MCNVEQQRNEVLDDINYLHLMQIVWSYSEMSDLKKLAVELPFLQFAKSLIIFEWLLVGQDPNKRRDDVQEMRTCLAESFQDFINAVESSNMDLPDLKEEFLKGIRHIFANFSPLQRNKADPSCDFSTAHLDRSICGKRNLCEIKPLSSKK